METENPKVGQQQLHLDSNNKFKFVIGGIVKLNKVNIAILLVIMLFPMIMFGQMKIGYVQSDRIRAEYEEFKEAEAQLQMDYMKVQEEYQVLLVELDSLQQAYEAQKLMSSPDWRTEKENEIAAKQQYLQQFQNNKVGPEGELYQKQAQMEYNLLSKVKTAVDDVAISKGYDFIFDGSVALLYGKPTHDLTDDVLFELNKKD